MPVKTDREYRSAVKFEPVAETENIVEGYASTFEPYVLASIDGVDYSERIAQTAFDAADMSDVIMQYDHSGKVMARTRNGSLTVSTDEHGLKIRADLSGSDAARELYQEIRSGLIDQMSFAFTIGADHYEAETRTRVIDSIRKVYDVSAVSIPANPGTEISARSYFDGVIEADRAERLRKAENEKAREELRHLFEVREHGQN